AGRLEHVDGKARVLPVVLPPVPPHEVSLTQEGLEALLSFLPSAVATRPEIGTADDAELRPITTMFVVVRGFRYPGEATVDDAQRVLEAIQECIYDHDGALNRFGVDDKGAVALAAWGLPPDDPVEQHLLPVRAALAIRGRLAQLGLDARVGLTAGQVWCGSVGNDRRCEYTIHGRSVNLAARLMMSAGTVLMDEHVAAGARGAVDVRRATPLRTKGRPDRVEVFEVARADGATICARGVELA
ncbi:MAG: adenylate/guanylate cyclase domain-containing protein, partial [Deltaproteobacteria bacterium]|nr:adenylate/guanylate cyclase domain-containing protein [Deltaproteobacteria bacterium]